MTQNIITPETEPGKQSGIRKTKVVFVTFIGGIVGGIVLAGIAVWLVMPSMMLVTHQSRYTTVEETCQQLKASIEANGWRCPAVRNINSMITEQGLSLRRELRIVELCKATYADEILESNPEVSTLMPCAWGVYAGDDGRVYITGMNMGLMGKMFGGTIARIMGGSVALDEQKMLQDVIR